jgi:hypothetical protein
MSQDHRKTARKHTCVPAYLYSGQGSPLGKCLAMDISAGGARLIYDIPGELSPKLQVTFGMVRRHCQLVWRRGNEIGVSFLL